MGLKADVKRDPDRVEVGWFEPSLLLSQPYCARCGEVWAGGRLVAEASFEGPVVVAYLSCGACDRSWRSTFEDD